MKKTVLIILLIVGFTWANKVTAQWRYTRIATYIGGGSNELINEIRCSIEKQAVPQVIEPVSTTFSSRGECEADRARSENYWNSKFQCYRVTCTPCSGPPNSDNKTLPGNINITGLETGQPFLVTNPGEITTEWITEYLQKMKALGFANTSEFVFPSSGNKEFDKAYDDLQQKYFDPNKKPQIFKTPKLEQISSQENVEDKYRKQMEEAQKELAGCTNDLCRLMAESKYNQAYNMLISMSQAKAEKTLSEYIRKEYEKQLDAPNKEKYDWVDAIIDYAALGIPVVAAKIPQLATGAGSFLVIANVSLWAEIAKACNNQSEYMGWNGTYKILTNAFTSATVSVVGGKVAAGLADVMPISGKQIQGIYMSKASTEKMKLLKNIEHYENVKGAVEIGLQAAPGLLDTSK